MNEMLDFEQEGKNSKNGVTAAMVLGGIVYLGVIVVATVLTWMFITEVIPQDMYLLQFLITLGVVAIGLNAVALPVALHFWAVDGMHRSAGIGFYGLDIVIMAVNLMVSFSTLRGNPPAWVESYTPYSVGMFVFALAAWAILWILDPGHKAGLELKRASQKFKVDAIGKATQYLDSTEGRAAIQKAADNLIPALFDADRILKKPTAWNAYAAETKAPALPVDGDEPAKLTARPPREER